MSSLTVPLSNQSCYKYNFRTLLVSLLTLFTLIVVCLDELIIIYFNYSCLFLLYNKILGSLGLW